MYNPMGVVVSLIVIAVGAILVWAVERDAEGVNVDTIGWILMIVGFVGFLIALLTWSSWWGGYRRRTYVEGEAPVRRTTRPRREVIEEEEVL